MASAITSVTPVNYAGTPTGSAVTSFANLSKYEFGLEDVLSTSSGENEAGNTIRMKIGERITLNAGWSGLTTAEAAVILSAFGHEYVLVSFLNPKTGASASKVFVVEAKTAPLLNVLTGLWDGIDLTLKQQGIS